MKVKTRVFHAKGAFKSTQKRHQEQLDDATKFINRIGPKRVFQITQSSGGDPGWSATVVWYYAKTKDD